MESIYFVFKGQGNHALYSASYGVRADQAAAEARVWQGNEALSRQLGKLFSRVNSQSAMESVTCWHAEQKKLYLVYRHANVTRVAVRNRSVQMTDAFAMPARCSCSSARGASSARPSRLLSTRWMIV